MQDNGRRESLAVISCDLTPLCSLYQNIRINIRYNSLSLTAPPSTGVSVWWSLVEQCYMTIQIYHFFHQELGVLVMIIRLAAPLEEKLLPFTLAMMCNTGVTTVI